MNTRVIPEFGVDGKVAYALVVVHDVTALAAIRQRNWRQGGDAGRGCQRGEG